MGACHATHPAGRMRIAFEPFEAPYPSPFRDMFGHFALVQTFFPYDPWSLETYRSRWREVDADWDRTRRADLVEALSLYLQSHGGRPAQRANLEKLARPGTVAVVAGQQAGLFTGPALTAWKAISVIRLAATLEKQLGFPVVPLFWIASEDHDHREASQAWVVDAADRLLCLQLPPLPPHRSIGDLPVPPTASNLIDQLLEGAANAPGVSEVRQILWSTWQAAQGQSLSDWFAHQMIALFGDQGLLLVDPMQPHFRRAAKPILLRAVEAAPAIAQALDEGARVMEEAGFHAPLQFEAGYLHLFHYVGGPGGPRLALIRDGDRVTTRKGEVSFHWSELPRRIAAEPGSFSPGVVLRPAVEWEVLPVLAHVCGVGEAAYLAQAARVWDVLGVRVPVLVPRLGMTVVPVEEREVLAQCGVSVQELWEEGDDVLQRIASQRSPLDVRARFALEREAICRRYEALIQDLALISPGLAELGAANLGRVLGQLDYLERKALQHERRRERGVLDGIRRARLWLFPRGRLQEEVLCLPALLARTGMDFLEAIAATAPVRLGSPVAHYVAHVL